VLGEDVIGSFPLGVVNAHAGDLPRYRGNACPNWAILNGEKRIGLCVHMMTPDEVDAGPVVARDYLPVDDETYIGDVYEWLDKRIPLLLSESVSALLQGSATPVPQPSNPQAGLRCYPRKPEDARIVWREPASAILRLIRASSRPFEGAFAQTADARRVTIWRASAFVHAGPFCAVPGQIMLRTPQGPVIACGDGGILLTSFELDGLSPEQSKAELMRSVRARLS
jgi:methionyl-tRNA formyltransferase